MSGVSFGHGYAILKGCSEIFQRGGSWVAGWSNTGSLCKKVQRGQNIL